MNQVKSAFAPIKPSLPAAGASSQQAPQKLKSDPLPAPPKLNAIERMEKHIVGKFFHFVYANGTDRRSGKIEAVLGDSHFTVRYFNRYQKLQKWVHQVRPYERPDVADLTGYWLFDDEATLWESLEELQEHMRHQKELLADKEANSEVIKQ